MATIQITLNGKTVECERGQTILDVAALHGVRIPTLCYHPQISRTGACRVCVVRVNKTMYKAACTEPVAPGMDIVTADPEILNLRRDTLEFLLAEGDHNCLYCEANGACELQALCFQHGIEVAPAAVAPKNVRTRDVTSSEGLRREENRCVLCGRCVKACDEVQLNRVWSFAGRGSHTHLTTGIKDVLGESDCVQCGQCVQLCPTGALSFQTVLGRGQAWELTSRTSVCVYCGVGCKINFFTNAQGQLVKAEGASDGPNNGHLCVKGRFGFDFVQSPTRLTTPLIRKDGQLVEATWDEALDYAARRLADIKASQGPDAIMSFTSAKCTNEENYLLQKFMRAVIGTNNVDHCARL
jgi:predicted molibdopterin-dependent oxidoreductase YjgC